MLSFVFRRSPVHRAKACGSCLVSAGTIGFCQKSFSPHGENGVFHAWITCYRRKLRIFAPVSGLFPADVQGKSVPRNDGKIQNISL